jgi:hypothetical protein
MHGQQNNKYEHLYTKCFIATKSVYLAERKMQIYLLEVSTYNCCNASSVINERSVGCVAYENILQSK